MAKQTKTVNERKTEELVRTKLRALGYNTPDNGITIEEQKSEIAKVKSLLAKASKNGKENQGYPEFIISNQKDTAFESPRVSWRPVGLSQTGMAV